MAQADVLPQTQQRTPGRPGDPCIMVIFGAAGDLTRRKLLPALYNLAKAQLLSREFAIVGVAHNAMSTDDFRNKLSEEIRHYAGAEVDPDDGLHARRRTGARERRGSDSPKAIHHQRTLARHNAPNLIDRVVKVTNRFVTAERKRLIEYRAEGR